MRYTWMTFGWPWRVRLLSRQLSPPTSLSHVWMLPSSPPSSPLWWGVPLLSTQRKTRPCHTHSSHQVLSLLNYSHTLAIQSKTITPITSILHHEHYKNCIVLNLLDPWCSTHGAAHGVINLENRTKRCFCFSPKIQFLTCIAGTGAVGRYSCHFKAL